MYVYTYKYMYSYVITHNLIIMNVVKKRNRVLPCLSPI